MKHTLSALSFLLLFTHNTFLSMDKTNQHEALETIDQAINTKYSSQNFFSNLTANLFSPLLLNEEEMFNIVGIITQYCGENPDNTLFDTLYARNSFFSTTVDHFTTLAQKNLNTLSAENLKIIENPEKNQPIQQLNKLTLPLKKYVMQRALKTITYTYDITLIGHKEDICAFDICEATDQAVTASQSVPCSPDNNSLYLWNLKTAKYECLDEKRPICLLAFSTDGNYIAAALFDTNFIHLWCPKTKQILMNINTHYNIETMQYTHPINHTLITTHRLNGPTQTIQQWALAERTVYKGENLCHNVTWPTKNHRAFMGTTYNPSSVLCLETRPFLPKNKLCVQKKSIPLYLCIQAIKNTQKNKSLHNTIEQSSSHHALTDLEKTIILEEIRKKTTSKTIPEHRTTVPLLYLNH